MIELLKPLQTDSDCRFWPMHRVTAWRVIKATMQSAGIAGPMACPKGLRHGFGIRAADCSVPTNPPRPLSISMQSGSRSASLPAACQFYRCEQGFMNRPF